MITMVLGKTGTGKSSLVYEMIDKNERLVVWDFANEYKLKEVNSLDRLKLILDNLYRFRVSYSRINFRRSRELTSFSL